MMPDLTPFTAILKQQKWMSKIDFIYLIKSQCDCTEERHKQLLNALYQLNFQQIMKGEKGEIVIK
jgi:hypothetical protein